MVHNSSYALGGKIANFLNLEQVYFRITLTIFVSIRVRGE